MRFIKSVFIALVVLALEFVAGFATFYNTRSVTYNDMKEGYRSSLQSVQKSFSSLLSAGYESVVAGDFSECEPLTASLSVGERFLRYEEGADGEKQGKTIESTTVNNLLSGAICFYTFSDLGLPSQNTEGAENTENTENSENSAAYAVYCIAKENGGVRLYFRDLDSFVERLTLTDFEGGVAIVSAAGNVVYSDNEVSALSFEKAREDWLQGLRADEQYITTINTEIKDRYLLVFAKLGDTGYYLGGCADFRAEQSRLTVLTVRTMVVFAVMALLVVGVTIAGLVWMDSEDGKFSFTYRIVTDADGVILRADKKFRKTFPKVTELSENVIRFNEYAFNTVLLNDGKEKKPLICTVKMRSNGTVVIYAGEINEKQIAELNGEKIRSMADVYGVFSHVGDRVLVGDIFLGNLYNIKTMFGDEFTSEVREILCSKIKKKFVHVYEMDYYNIGILQSDGKPLDNLMQDLPDIVTYINQPIKIENNLVMVGVKCGFALSDGAMKDRSYEYVMTAVNAALKRAEQDSADYYLFHESQKKQYLKAFMKFDIRQMLADGDFEMEYQPQYSLTENRIVGFEALFRVKRRVELNVNTFDLITYAERSGDMVLLGDFIFDTGMRFAKRIEDTGVSVSLNVSPVQLMQAGFVDNFLKIFRKYDLKPGAISVEITESFLMSTFDETIKKLEILVANGIDVHLDDFGTKYSSLLYLKNLPISTIKIDREFIVDIDSNTYSHAITQMILTTTRALKLKNICEGVETWEQLESLRQLGGEIIQGFLVGKSRSEDDAFEMISSFRLPDPPQKHVADADDAEGEYESEYDEYADDEG